MFECEQVQQMKPWGVLIAELFSHHTLRRRNHSSRPLFSLFITFIVFKGIFSFAASHLMSTCTPRQLKSFLFQQELRRREQRQGHGFGS